jgi:hypothetical protein
MDLKSGIIDSNLPVVFVDKFEAFCNFSLQECSLRDGKNWFIYDSGHLTVEGAIFLGKQIVDKNWFNFK